MDFLSFAEASKQVNPILKLAGISEQEGLAMLSSLANAGILSSLGGTGVKNIINSIMKPTEEMKKALDELKGKGTIKSTASADVFADFNEFLQELVKTKDIEEIFRMFNLRAVGSVAQLKKLGEEVTRFRKDITYNQISVSKSAEEIRKSWKILFERIKTTIANIGINFIESWKKFSTLGEDENPLKKILDTLLEFNNWLLTLSQD
jgi:TP901 family phage tail tape measure protein